MKWILIFALIALVAIQATWAQDEECSDGETRKEDCNDCYCTHGLWACTRKDCDPRTLTIKNKRDVDAPCTDGQSKKDDCNSCQCNNGHWACTQKACPPRH